MKWWDRMPWSLFSECWALSQLFHSPLSSIARPSLIIWGRKDAGRSTSMTICCCSLVTKSRPTLCNAMDCSPPGSSVHGILQARILEWIAISFSRGSSWPMEPTRVSCICRQILYLWATWEALCDQLLLFSHQFASNSLWPHGLQHTRPPCPLPSPRVCSSSCPLNWWCHWTIFMFSRPLPW